MNFLKSNRRSRITLILLSLLLVVIPLYLYSCGGSVGGGYDTCVDPKINVLVDADTLNGWITNGYGSDDSNCNRIVVLHVGDDASYSAGHVPGAYQLTDSDYAATRSDGVSETNGMVATKAQMDDLIQRTGIDARTVVVLTGRYASSAMNIYKLTRSYFNFRYWGFPRNRIRVLDGFVDTTWANAGYAVDTTPTPASEASDYSVCSLTPDPDRFRAPLEEMRNIAMDDDVATVVIDTRRDDEYNATINTTGGPTFSGFVAFEGHARTAVHQEWINLLDTEMRLLPKNDLTSIFTGINVDETTTAYPYCRTSFRAAVTFLALDGVLNYPVKIYDGGWLEWGQMTSTALLGGLADTSPWRTDFIPLGDGEIIDNNSDGVLANGYEDTFEGASSNTGGADCTDLYGTDFRYDGTADGGLATWTPQTLSAGTYNVSVWHVAKSSYSTNAAYTVNHNGAADNVTVDLTANGCQWYSIGTYDFVADGVTVENITLSDSGASTGFVVADAVKFTPVMQLTESITHNTNVEPLTGANSFAFHADGVNTEDAAICTSGDTGGGGGGGAAPGY